MHNVAPDPVQYLFGFSFTKLVDKPFGRLAATFAVVASALTVTKRHDIRRDGSWAIRAAQWYPVIHSQCVPQPRRSTANGTATVKVIKRVLPIFGGELGWQFKLTALSALIIHSLGFTVSLLRSTTNFSDLSRVILPISFFTLALYFTTFVIALAIVSVDLFFIGAGSVAVSLCTSTAFNAQKPAVAVKERFCRQKFIAAFNAALEGVGDIQHSVSPSLYHRMLPAGGVIAAFR